MSAKNTRKDSLIFIFGFLVPLLVFLFLIVSQTITVTQNTLSIFAFVLPFLIILTNRSLRELLKKSSIPAISFIIVLLGLGFATIFAGPEKVIPSVYILGAILIFQAVIIINDFTMKSKNISLLFSAIFTALALILTMSFGVCEFGTSSINGLCILFVPAIFISFLARVFLHLAMSGMRISRAASFASPKRPLSKKNRLEEEKAIKELELLVKALSYVILALTLLLMI